MDYMFGVFLSVFFCAAEQTLHVKIELFFRGGKVTTMLSFVSAQSLAFSVHRNDEIDAF